MVALKISVNLRWWFKPPKVNDPKENEHHRALFGGRGSLNRNARNERNVNSTECAAYWSSRRH
jgi:hypothetical protein